MSTPNPGDVLPLEPGHTGRGDPGRPPRYSRPPRDPRPPSVSALEAAGGAELLRQVLEEQKSVDGTYTVIKPDKPLGSSARSSETLLTGGLGRTPRGWPSRSPTGRTSTASSRWRRNRLRLGYQVLLVKEWDGDLGGLHGHRPARAGQDTPDPRLDDALHRASARLSREAR